jgi:hypothetical protein
MRHEFNSRIAAQRAILRVLNARKWESEELFSLSSKAIDRWVAANRLSQDSRLVKLVREVSAKLFFLANRSQQQISDDYRMVSAEVGALRDAIAREASSAV